MSIFTDMVYTKEFALVYFFLVFLLIVINTFRKSKKERIENFKNIPFEEDI